MAAALSGDAIGALRELLEKEEDVALGPRQTVVAPRAAVTSKNKAIWEDSEVPSEDALIFDPKDCRQRAEFEMVYKQLVNCEDLYLGTEKTPASAHSNALVYRIFFPKHKRSEIDVEATASTLRAESARLKLGVYLPQPALAEQGSAKWDAAKEALEVTLPLSY